MANKFRSYPTDVSDEEWAFCAPYLTLMNERAPQRKHALRAVFDALRWLVRASSFEAMAHDLRLLLRLAAQRSDAPSAIILDSRTLQSRPDSGARAGFDGHKKRKGSKDAAVDTLGHLLALKVTPADEQDRARVAELTQALQEVSGEQVEVAFVDQGYTGEQPAADAAQAGVRLEVVKHHEVK